MECPSAAACEGGLEDDEGAGGVLLGAELAPGWDTEEEDGEEEDGEEEERALKAAGWAAEDEEDGREGGEEEERALTASRPLRRAAGDTAPGGVRGGVCSPFVLG